MTNGSEPEPAPEPSLELLEDLVDLINGPDVKVAVSAYVLTLTPPGACTFDDPVVNGTRLEWLVTVVYIRVLTEEEFQTNQDLIQTFITQQFAVIGVSANSVSSVSNATEPPMYDITIIVDTALQVALTAQEILDAINNETEPFALIVLDFLTFDPPGIIIFEEAQLNGTFVIIPFNVTYSSAPSDEHIGFSIEQIILGLRRYQSDPDLIRAVMVQSEDNELLYFGNCTIFGSDSPPPEPANEPEPVPAPTGPTRDQILILIGNSTVRARITILASSLNPPGTVSSFDEPITIGGVISWTIEIRFPRELSGNEQTTTEGLLRSQLGTDLQVELSQINVALFLTSTDASKRAIQAFSYDAVATISGASQMAASALLAVLFLALFI